jgi:predicted ATPase
VSQLLCNILVLRRQPEQCVEVATAGRRLAEEHLLVFWIAGLRITGGWSLARSGRMEEGIEQMRSGIAAWKATGASLHLPTWYSYLADALLLAGAADDAEAAISEAINIGKRNGDVLVLSDLYRLHALAFVRTGRPMEAEARLLEARATAARQGAKLFELRAARDLASFWADQGQRHQADALLRPVYAAITEGLDRPDLVEARELLQRLETN